MLGSEHGVDNVGRTMAINGKPIVDNVRPHHDSNSLNASLDGANAQRRSSSRNKHAKKQERGQQKERTRALQKQIKQRREHLLPPSVRARGKRDDESHSGVRKHHGSSVYTKRSQTTPAEKSGRKPTRKNTRRAAEK